LTESVLRALGGTDERYFLAYAETMKEKHPKKIVLRRWLSAAAVIILATSLFTLFLLPRQKEITKETFSNYKDMIYQTYGRIDTHLASLPFEEYEKVRYDCYVRHSHSSDMLVASYVITLYNNQTKTEILFLPAVSNQEYYRTHFIPEITNAEEHYTETMKRNDIVIRYGQENDRVFGEWEDETGYYKIICYSNQRDVFETVLTDLLS